MSQLPQDVKTACSSCDRETWHEVLYAHVESIYEYRMDTVHEVVQCRGCKTISFRKVEKNFEDAYPIGDNEWEVPEDIWLFPSVLRGHRELEDVEDVPSPVKAIYTQAVHAIRDELNILAGIGLRATIEAICNERGIVGRTLDKRIDGLVKGGLISQKDAERLHAIRFLGNDAAHEILTIDPKNLIIALRIIEHLLVNIYILDSEAEGKLETIIKTPAKFIEILDKKVSALSKAEEIPIAKIFGKDVRRFHGYLATHEATLIAEIAAGNYIKLSIGKVDNYAGSKDKLQHFIVR